MNYVRLMVLMAGEIAKELYQAERQRGRLVEPRMRRGLHYAVERAVTNIALRTVSTAFVIEEMYSGAPTIYVDYTGYDAISHHCGPEREEAIDALAGIDRAIGSLLKAARHTSRVYRLVVLSGHGQCLGATFRQCHGQPLEAVIATVLPDTMSVVGTTDSIESSGIGRRMAAEFGRGTGLGSLVARRLPSALRRFGRGARPGATEAPPDVVVASSGNLAHVYFASGPDRMTNEAIETLYPGLIEALSGHPGIGALMVKSAASGVLVFGPRGRLGLTSGQSDGIDPLADYGLRAAENLFHLDGFPNAGDLILLGAVDRVSGEVTGFEELVGSHGGLGGWQAEPLSCAPRGSNLPKNRSSGRRPCTASSLPGRSNCAPNKMRIERSVTHKERPVTNDRAANSNRTPVAGDAGPAPDAPPNESQLSDPIGADVGPLPPIDTEPGSPADENGSIDGLPGRVERGDEEDAEPGLDLNRFPLGATNG